MPSFEGHCRVEASLPLSRLLYGGLLNLFQLPCRVEKAERAAAQQVDEVLGRYKVRLSEAEAAHAERACVLQHEMKQRLEQAQIQAKEGVASARRWELPSAPSKPHTYGQPAA